MNPLRAKDQVRVQKGVDQLRYTPAASGLDIGFLLFSPLREFAQRVNLENSFENRIVQASKKARLCKVKSEWQRNPG